MGGLSFDRDQRYQTLREVARRLGVQSSHTVLDVGGGTGELGALLGCKSFWTADLLGGGPNHVTASMDRLPFEKGSFDLVVQADALEHVPQALRHSAMNEMARVSRRWLIWIGPVDSSEAVEAEEDLCTVHKVLFGGREMDWLVEHRRHGLPHGEEVVCSLGQHFQDWAWWPSCGVRTWWSFKRLELQLATGPYRPQLEAAINQWYGSQGWKADYRITGFSSSYRWVFVGCKQGELPGGIDVPPPPPSLVSTTGVLTSLIEAVVGEAGLSLNGEPQAPSVALQLERIAALVENQAPEQRTGLFSRLFGR